MNSFKDQSEFSVQSTTKTFSHRHQLQKSKVSFVPAGCSGTVISGFLYLIDSNTL